MDWLLMIFQALGKSLFGKLFVIISIIFLLVFAPKTVRYYTDFTVGSLEETARTLDSLENLEQSDVIKNDEDLRFAHNKIKSDFMEHIRGDHSIKLPLLRVWLWIQNPDFSFMFGNSALKFLSSSLLSIILLVFAVLKKDLDKRCARIVNLVFLGGTFGAFGFLIPNITSHSWIDIAIIFFVCSPLSFWVYKKRIR